MPNMRSMFDFYCVSSGWHSQFGDMKPFTVVAQSNSRTSMINRDKKKTHRWNQTEANSSNKTHDAANHDDFSHSFTWIASSVEISS